MNRFYTVILSQDRPGGPYGATFPDFPGCTAVEGSENAVMVSATQALQGHIDAMVKDGDTLPAATPLDGLHHLRAEPDVVAVGLVGVQVPGRSVRANITMDESLLARLDAAAAQRGTTRSGLLAELVARHMH